jgi:Uma2 family endonuclease
MEQGLEADECYWIQHAEQMCGKTTFDPDADPPPDLALEVEVSRSVLPRLRIYASLGIPEIWRYDGQAIHVLLRGANGEYQESPTSAALPMVPVAELSRFLELLRTTSETQVSRQFFDWVREQHAAGWAVKKPRGRKKK